MRFSQRIGKTPSHKQLQIESIDSDLSNSLLNVFQVFVLENLFDDINNRFSFNRYYNFAFSYYHNFLKEPITQIPDYKPSFDSTLRRNFTHWEWFQKYDFLEFLLEEVSNKKYQIDIHKLQDTFNYILEREFSGFRFINYQLTPITNENEIETIENAISETKGIKTCSIHLNSALHLLSDRLNPDYRNSIKESISAVEAIAKIISKNNKDSLGGALDKIKGKMKIHSSLEKGFKQIYGYTSDSDGIRHALTDNPNCDFDDAKFMLVSCSAFVNYLISKANKNGIAL